MTYGPFSRQEGKAEGAAPKDALYGQRVNPFLVCDGKAELVLSVTANKETTFIFGLYHGPSTQPSNSGPGLENPSLSGVKAR